MLGVTIVICIVHLSDGASLQPAVPTDAWLEQCEDFMKKENASKNFAMAVAHGIHSMSLQDLRAFFKESAGPENGIPTVNRNLKAADEKIVEPNAPDIPGDFHSIGMHTFDVALRFMDNPNYIQSSGILERLSHHFHMQETWTKAQPFYQNYMDSGVESSICACAMDAAGNGIVQELTNIFLYFRDLFNKSNPKPPKKNRKQSKAMLTNYDCYGYMYWYRYGYRYFCSISAISSMKQRNNQGGPKPKNEPLPKLNSSKAWTAWKKMLHSSMMEDDDVKKFALFMYCATFNEF